MLSSRSFLSRLALLCLLSVLAACDSTVLAPATGTVQATVRDPAGIGVQGIGVILSRADAPSLSAHTDSDGAVRFTDVSTGTWELAVELPQDYAPASPLASQVTVEVRQGWVVGHDFSLPLGHARIVVTVRDTAGERMAGVPVAVYQPSGMRFEALTTADGAARFGGLPEGTYSVGIIPPGGYLPSPPGSTTVSDVLLTSDRTTELEFRIRPPFQPDPWPPGMAPSEVLFACGQWSGALPAAARPLVDLLFSGDGITPNAAHLAIAETLGAEVLAQFHFPGARVRIDALRIPELHATGVLNHVRSVPDPTRSDWTVLVRYQAPPDAAELAAFRAAGGRVTNVYTILPLIAGDLPNAAIPGIRARPQVERVSVSGVGCTGG
jgi:hypothetical protein